MQEPATAAAKDDKESTAKQVGQNGTEQTQLQPAVPSEANSAAEKVLENDEGSTDK